MTDTKSYPYITHLDIKFSSLDLIDVGALAKSVTDQWYNQTLCRVNDSVVRLGVMQGEYHWHKHDNDDEFFFVLKFSSSLSPAKRPCCRDKRKRIGAVWVSRTPESSSTGISPISLTDLRHSAVRVTPPPKLVQIGSND